MFPSISGWTPGLRPFFVAHAVGTQNYMFLPSGASFAWTLVGPPATLFNDRGEQVATHFLSPNPDQPGTTVASRSLLRSEMRPLKEEERQLETREGEREREVEIVVDAELERLADDALRRGVAQPVR